MPSIDQIIKILVPFLVVVSALLLQFAVNFNMDSDPLWSIGVGEWINNHRAVPSVDVFSWTVAGEPWFSNSWLFCWLMYMADQSLGYIGVSLLILIPYLIAGYFIFIICRNYHKSSFSILVFWVCIIFLIILSVTPRAYIYTFAFIAIIMYIIRFKRDSIFIFAIPLIMLLWANIHESMRFGIALLFIEALVSTVFFKDKRLWPIFILSLLATLVNPYGFGFWDISFSGFFDPGTQYINEWRAPDFNNLGILAIYLFMFAIGLLGAFRLKDEIHREIVDRDKIMILFWFWSALLYSLTMIRAIYYVQLLLAPCFVAIATKSPGENRFFKPVLLVLIILFFIFVLAYSLPLFPLEIDPQSEKPINFIDYLQLNPKLHDSVSHIIPAEAVIYLKDNPSLQVKLFNSYLFGGYLLLNNIDVFIDARAVVFMDQSVFDDYLEIITMRNKPEIIINKYNINSFLLSKEEPLEFYLELHPEWEKEYEDDIAVIYTKLRLD